MDMSKKIMSDFREEYPNADMSKFYYKYGVVTVKISGFGEVDADSSTFLSSPYKSWLYSNKKMNDKVMSDFKIKYPKADLSKFYVYKGSIYTNDSDIGWVEIGDPPFRLSMYHDMWLLGKRHRYYPLDSMSHLSEAVPNRGLIIRGDLETPLVLTIMDGLRFGHPVVRYQTFLRVRFTIIIMPTHGRLRIYTHT